MVAMLLVISGDIPDIFVLLVYLTWRCGLQGRIAVQMEMRDGIILEVNATCSEFEGTVCSQLLGAHASTCLLTATQCPTLSARVTLQLQC